MTKGFSPEWDATYRSSQHISVWPWSDLVSLVMRYAHPKDGFLRVLELGCGAGANIQFFVDTGADYWAVEGSQAIVSTLRQRYPALSEQILVGDFTSSIPCNGVFDLVIDRSSLTHNNTAAIQRGLALAYDTLRPNGKFIGVNWFSTKNQYAEAGTMVDSHTRRDIPAPLLEGLGKVHFSDFDHLDNLFRTAGFIIDYCEHVTKETTIPESIMWASWNFVATKPEPSPSP